MITSNGSGTATGLPNNRKYKFNKTLREFTGKKKKIEIQLSER